jgi:hypothetical protein
MGNATEMLCRPDSAWVHDACALVMDERKQWDRSLVAFSGAQDDPGEVVWPATAVDPASPGQARPLWRETWLSLAKPELHGRRCVIIVTSDTKPRLWYRARLGRIGIMTPVLMHLPEEGTSAVQTVNLEQVAEDLLVCEELLDAGFSRGAIQHNLFALLPPAVAYGLERTRAREEWLRSRRRSPELLLACHAARTEPERTARAMAREEVTR